MYVVTNIEAALSGGSFVDAHENLERTPGRRTELIRYELPVIPYM